MPKMDVPQPIYEQLLAVKARLSIQRKRNVTFPETWEHVMGIYAATDDLAQDLRKAGR